MADDSKKETVRIPLPKHFLDLLNKWNQTHKSPPPITIIQVKGQDVPVWVNRKSRRAVRK
jgi:hypothetical protein